MLRRSSDLLFSRIALCAAACLLLASSAGAQGSAFDPTYPAPGASEAPISPALNVYDRLRVSFYSAAIPNLSIVDIESRRVATGQALFTQQADLAPQEAPEAVATADAFASSSGVLLGEMRPMGASFFSFVDDEIAKQVGSYTNPGSGGTSGGNWSSNPSTIVVATFSRIRSSSQELEDWARLGSLVLVAGSAPPQKEIRVELVHAMGDASLLYVLRDCVPISYRPVEGFDAAASAPVREGLTVGCRSLER